MKILMISNHLGVQSGVQRYVQNLLLHLDTAKYRVTLFVGQCPPDQASTAPALEAHGVELLAVPDNKKDRIRALAAHLRTHKDYDIIHYHTASKIGAPVCGMMRVLCPRAKIVVHSHIVYPPMTLTWRAAHLVYQLFADYFLGCGVAAGRFVFGDHIDAKPNFSVACNAVDAGRFHPDAAARAATRAAWGITDTDRLAGFVGRLNHQKNPLFLMEVFAAMAAQDRISMFGYGLFACLFVSYPLMNEIWEYSGANVCVCGGYLLDAAALNLLWDARQPGVPWRGRALHMGAAALCLMVVCSSYESLAAVYVLAVFALLTLEQLLAAERPRLAAVLTEGLWYAAALVGGLCLRVLVTSGIHLVLPQAAANGATEILWAFYPFVYLAKLLVKSILINYALRGCFYLPIAELAVAVPVFVALVIVLAVRKKRPLLLLTGAGMLLSLVLLSFVQGRYSPYRTCQVFALFVALAGLAVYELLRRAAARRAVLLGSVQLLAVLLCLHQAMYLNHLLAVDYQRSEQEAAVVRTLGTELVRDYGTDKPVVLVGRYTLGENITRYTTADPMQHPLYRFFREHTSWESGDTVKYVETNCNSVLNWSITAFSEVDDVYGQAAEHLFRYYGFALDMTHSAALHEQAQTYADAHDLPGYPRTGAIVDCGDYVLVNLQ